MFKEWEGLRWKTISVNCIIIMRKKQGLFHCLQGARNSQYNFIFYEVLRVCKTLLLLSSVEKKAIY